MPLYDALGGTINSISWELQKQVDQGTTPDLVLVDVLIDDAATHHACMGSSSNSPLLVNLKIDFTGSSNS